MLRNWSRESNTKEFRTLKTINSFFFLIVVLTLLMPVSSYGSHNEPESGQEVASPEEDSKRFAIEFEPDAYYTNLALYIALTKTPIPHLGEMTEAEFYKALLSRAFEPRFLVLEASVNPMPYLGVYLKEHEREFYDEAQVSGSLNWVKALTAGFEEPHAASAFIGNMVDFDTPGRKDVKGKGFIGFLMSTGNYHIKDNELIPDDWNEFEWKIKGDRKSPIKKLSWSFRVGTKIHQNLNIADIVYLSLRRSRLDYEPEHTSIFNNSGFEYTFDMDKSTLHSMRHYFFIDKKWPLKGRKVGLALAAGFVWESKQKYTGELAAGREDDDFQVILRPNIEF